MSAYVEVWKPGERLFVALGGAPVSVGSDPSNNVVLGGDRSVSRVHAVRVERQ
jgi:hypothetical protein